MDSLALILTGDLHREQPRSEGLGALPSVTWEYEWPSHRAGVRTRSRFPGQCWHFSTRCLWLVTLNISEFIIYEYDSSLLPGFVATITPRPLSALWSLPRTTDLSPGRNWGLDTCLAPCHMAKSRAGSQAMRALIPQLLLLTFTACAVLVCSGPLSPSVCTCRGDPSWSVETNTNCSI